MAHSVKVGSNHTPAKPITSRPVGLGSFVQNIYPTKKTSKRVYGENVNEKLQYQDFSIIIFIIFIIITHIKLRLENRLSEKEERKREKNRKIERVLYSRKSPKSPSLF